MTRSRFRLLPPIRLPPSGDLVVDALREIQTQSGVGVPRTEHEIALGGSADVQSSLLTCYNTREVIGPLELPGRGMPVQLRDRLHVGGRNARCAAAWADPTGQLMRCG